MEELQTSLVAKGYVQLFSFWNHCLKVFNRKLSYLLDSCLNFLGIFLTTGNENFCLFLHHRVASCILLKRIFGA